MLVTDRGPGAIPIERNGGAREIHGPSPRIDYHLHPIGIGDEASVERTGGGSDDLAPAQAIERPAQRVHRDERLVTLDIQDPIEVAEAVLTDRLGDALGSRFGTLGGEDGLITRALHDRSNLPRLCGDHNTIAHSGLDDASNDPEDEGFACEGQEWLARKAAGTEPRGDHT
jgi:hypothetical protein